jgi:hypothetical protein
VNELMCVLHVYFCSCCAIIACVCCRYASSHVHELIDAGFWMHGARELSTV